MQIQCLNSVPGNTITINVYQVDAVGRVVRAQQSLVPNSTRSQSAALLPLAEGYLMGVTVSCSAANQVGQCWVRCVLNLGLPSTPQPMMTICQGYVTSQNRLYGPNSILWRTNDGRGNFRSVQGTLPAAGADINEVVPAGALWRLVSMNYSLVTSAAVANRLSGFVIDDGANIVLNLASQGNAVASNTYGYNAVNGSNLVNAVQPPTNWPVPCDMWLPAGFRIRTLTANIQAGDQLSAPNYLVEEFMNG